MPKQRLLFISACAAVIACTAIGHTAPYYKIEWLELPAGATQSSALGLNADGTAVGFVTLPTLRQLPVVWNTAGEPTVLSVGDSPHDFAATSINDIGTVVGWGRESGQTAYSAVMWRGGMLTVLAAGDQSGNNTAVSVNNSDTVLLTRYLSPTSWQMHRWTDATGLMSLGTLGGSGSTAAGIAESGLAVGHSIDASGITKACQYRPGVGLGALSFPDPAAESRARAISSNGSVAVGMYADTIGKPHPVRWLLPSNTWQPLPDLAGYTSGDALGVNNNNWAVGWASNGITPVRAVLYHPQDGTLDLNAITADLPAGVTLRTAAAINNDGVIVGAALVDTGGDVLLRAFRARPVYAITGVSQIDGYPADGAVQVASVEVRRDGELYRTTTIQTGPLTPFAIVDLPNGIYTVRIKTPTTLAVRFEVTVLNDSAEAPEIRLINGDADNDNMVTLYDYLALDGAFGTPVGDLDGDGQVTLFDYLIVDRSFGAVGS